MRYRPALEMSEPIRKIQARKRELRQRRLLFLVGGLIAVSSSLNAFNMPVHPSLFRTCLHSAAILVGVTQFGMATIFWKAYERRLNRKAEVFVSEVGDSELWQPPPSRAAFVRS